MRSIGFTFVLLLAALGAVGGAAWRWMGRDFEAVTGVPATGVGEALFGDFKGEEVKFIEVSQGEVGAKFSLGAKGWVAEEPWADRMDARAAGAIIGFTLGMKVRDYADRDEIDLEKVGLGETGTNIKLLDAGRNVLAKYRMGRRSSWMAAAEEENGVAVPTVFIRVREEGRDQEVYCCTGDIAPLFKDGLRFLRDHRPFYFNPLGLEQIRIRSGDGEFLLGRESPKSAWRVVKPLDSATDVEAMKSLITGLFELQAVKVTDRGAMTVQTEEVGPKPTEIGIRSFGSDAEVLLTVAAAVNAEARTAVATVSDRPETVFELPLTAEQGVVSLASVTLGLNDVRDASLSKLNVKSLQAISIEPRTGSTIVVSRVPPKPWMVSLDGSSQEANEERLFALLKAVTEAKAIGFESDAATDFTPWGLDNPFLKLRFLGGDNQVLEIAFGMDGKGGYFANRTGSATVMRVDSSVIGEIAVRPYEWRMARLWSVDRNQLFALSVMRNGEEPVVLKYSFKDDRWTARRASEDLTGELDPSRASYLLGMLEGLKVTRWLAPDDEGASRALIAPTLSFTILEKATDEFGDATGEVMTRGVRFAPNVVTGIPSFYYGRMDQGGNPFLLDTDTYQKLAMDVLDRR